MRLSISHNLYNLPAKFAKLLLTCPNYFYVSKTYTTLKFTVLLYTIILEMMTSEPGVDEKSCTRPYWQCCRTNLV